MADRDIFELLRKKKRLNELRALKARQTQPVVAPQQDPSFGQQALGALENVGALVTGAIAEPLAGLAGIGALLPGGQTPTEAIASTREALTFKPRTETAQAQAKSAGEFLAPVGKALSTTEKFLGDNVLELTGSPALAAAAHSLPTAALELLGFKGAKRITGAPKESSKRAIKKSVVESAPEIEQIKNASRSVYKEIDDSGVTVKDSSFNRLADNIKTTRKAKGISQEILAHEAGLYRTYVGHIETGTYSPSAYTIYKIAKALKVSLSDLFTT